jgi:hypothetical protein
MENNQSTSKRWTFKYSGLFRIYFFSNQQKLNHDSNRFIFRGLPEIDHFLLVGGFRHFFIFHNIWDNPIDELIFFKMVIAPPTS